MKPKPNPNTKTVPTLRRTSLSLYRNEGRTFNTLKHPGTDLKNQGGFLTMGRTKQGNRNAQSNTNAKKGNRTSSEMVEFTTGQVKEKKNRFQD
jgi:hypothetical protein